MRLCEKHSYAAGRFYGCAGEAWSVADAAAGEGVFKSQCAVCHSVQARRNQVAIKRRIDKTRRALPILHRVEAFLRTAGVLEMRVAFLETALFEQFLQQ